MGLYFLLFVSGFTIGFGHCIGMCGPIAVFLSLNLKHKRILVVHLLYHSGRIFTYAVLGGIMGAGGTFTGVTASILGIQKIVLIAAGALITCMGLAMTDWVPAGRIFRDSNSLGGLISAAYQKLAHTRSTVAYLPLGLLLGLLPCGPVYTALIAAARSGMAAENVIEGLFSGAGLMMAFGAGTAPALVLVGRVAGMGWIKSKTVLYKSGAVLMIFTGVYFVIKGIQF
ncbi:MAG: sulfite exporter TauE/SafE family protein [Deltaproteobacteria bacterium]|nr:sulfite exporter TauE/SafE family protein [Deltaproteobacteria bacterium]